MRKIISIVLVVLLALTTFGCAEQPTPPKQPPQPGEDDFRPSLGGIKLGDSKEQLLQAFGNKYEEDKFEDESSLGEHFVRMSYPNGIMAIVGLKTSKVLEIETSSESTVTNLGFKIGDKADAVLAKYRTMYQEPDSRHQPTKLIGWFLLKDEELIIFNFDQDEVLVNDPKLKPDSKVKRIKLSNFKYMD